MDVGVLVKTGAEVIAAISGGESRPEKQAVTITRLIIIESALNFIFLDLRQLSQSFPGQRGQDVIHLGQSLSVELARL